MRLLIFLSLVLLFLVSCDSSTNKDENSDASNLEHPQTTLVDDDLEKAPHKVMTSPLESKELVVLVDNSIASFFVYKGELLGFEYEMLKSFCDETGLKLTIKKILDKDAILDSLVAGHGHMVAANLTINRERKKKVDFTQAVFTTKQVLIQKMPGDWRNTKPHVMEKKLVRDPLELDGKTVSIRSNTSYRARLENYCDETGIEIKFDTLGGDVMTEHTMEMVSNAEVLYTVADKNVANIYKRFYPSLDIKTELSLSQPIAWAISKKYPELRKALNQWITKNKGSLYYNMTYKKYFDVRKVASTYQRNELESVKKGKISKYDDLIKKYAEQIGWDWRLLAAQINKESQFNPKTTSWAGAKGLMQVLPTTAKEQGVDGNLFDPETGIKAGTIYLQWLENYWKNEITSSEELQNFVLGSYNVGPGHVRDAMRLCKKHNLNPHVWEGNVEVMLLNKSKPSFYNDPVVKFGYCRGAEPVEYVKTIKEYYTFYMSYTEL